MDSRKVSKWYSHVMALIGRTKSIQQISAHTNVHIANMASVYENSRMGLLSDEETRALDNINQLRSQLMESDEQMHFKKIWEPEDSEAFGEEAAIAVKDMARTAAIPKHWGEFHFRLLRTYRPEKCLELGTNVGVSGAYLASALSLNHHGLLVTLEGIESFANVAAKGFNSLGLPNIELITGLFQETLPQVLHKHKAFDYVFIDGHHQKQPTLDYFEEIKPFLAENAVVVFDDIYWSTGMKEAWDIVSQDDGAQAAFDFYKLGIIIFNADSKKQTDYFRLALYL